MSKADGLFENPNQEEALQQEEQSTLSAIKDDTGAIREAIYQFGGAELDRGKAIERAAKSAQQHNQQSQREIAALIEKGVVLIEKRDRLIEKKERLIEKKERRAEKQNPIESQVFGGTQAVRKWQKFAKNRPLAQPDTVADTHHAKVAIAQRKKKKRSNAEHSGAETLPFGWQRDQNGRVRDRKGRYVTEKQLAKHNIKNPPKTDNSAENDTEKTAKDRRILDALGGIQDAIENPENLDPLINATQELSAPLKMALSATKATAEFAGRGMSKVFGGGDKSQRWREKFFGYFRKSQQNDERKQNQIVDWLRKIWKKDDSKGGGLFGTLAKLFPTLLGGLGKGLLGRFGKLFAGGIVGKLFGGLFKGGIAKGGFGALAKGLFKRLPIIGSLLAFADGGLAGGIGSIAGGALGSFFGPIGTIIGALVGEKVGVWLATLNWAEVGKWISEKWQAVTEVWHNVGSWFQSQWQPISDWFSLKWQEVIAAFSSVGDWLSESWTALTQSIQNKWDSVAEAFKSVWDSVAQWFSDLVPDWVKNGASQVSESVSGVASRAGDYLSEKWNGLVRWVTGEDSPADTESQASDAVSNVANLDTSKMVDEQEKSSSLLGALLDATKKGYEALKEKLAQFLDQTQYINGVKENGLPLGAGLSTQVTNAADYALQHAAESSLGKCAEYVNNALKAQGISSFGHGKEVAQNLIDSKQGFSAVEYNENYVPQIGDVMSMPSNSSSEHPYGHVAIYTAEGWVSDFKQGEKYGNTAAANQQYWEEIKAGRIKPTIARKSSGVAYGAANMALNTTAYLGGANAVSGSFGGFGSAVDGYITQAANQYGMDEATLRGFVSMEGGWTGKDSATGAIGVGQFTRGAWNDLANSKEGEAIGMTAITDGNFRTAQDPRRNQQINTLATALLMKKNQRLLEGSGIAATPENLYMAHNMGAGFVRAIYGKQAFTADTRRNMDVNGGKGMTPQQFIEFQKGRFRSHYARANSGGIASATLNLAKTAERFGKIPSPPAIRDNAGSIAQSVAQTAAASKQTAPPKAEATVIAATNADPILAFLTQDVSERRIAHIVTGGLTRRTV